MTGDDARTRAGAERPRAPDPRDDPWLPRRLDEMLDVAAAEVRVYRAYRRALAEWLAVCRREVLSGAAPSLSAAAPPPDPDGVARAEAELLAAWDRYVAPELDDAFGARFAAVLRGADLSDRPWREAFAEQARARVRHVSATTHGRIRDVVAAGIRDGLPIEAIAKGVEQALRLDGRHPVWTMRAEAASLLTADTDAEIGRLRAVDLSERDRAWHDRFEQATRAREAARNADTAARTQLRGTLGDWRGRAVTIARTETMAAVNGGTVSAMQARADAFGEAIEKVWLATYDLRTRPTHFHADTQRVPLGGRFTVGDAQLDYPGDPTGPPGEVVNCRCTVLEYREGEAMYPDTGRQYKTPAQRRSVEAHFDALRAAGEPLAEPTHAGLAVHAADTGRVLLLQRAMTDLDDPAAGMWEFPGGAVEPGETPAQAAYREFAEETGVVPPEGDNGGTWTSPDGVYRGHRLVVAEETAVPMNPPADERAALNPDDPDGDRPEVMAWFQPADLLGMPSLRPEVADSTDWTLFGVDGAGLVAAAPAGGDLPNGWQGFVAPIDRPTGDGRVFGPTWTVRDLPLAFEWQRSEADGHDGAVVVGTVLEVEEREVDGVRHVWAAGPLDLASEDGAEFSRQLRDGFATWVSVSPDDFVAELVTPDGEPVPPDAEGSPDDVLLRVEPWRLMSVTAVANAAFNEARVEPVFGYVPPAERAVDTAAPSPPGAPLPAGNPFDDAPAVVAAAAPSPPAEWFTDPRLDRPTPLTVTPDGRVVGHLATWGTCHTSFTGTCLTPPRSRSGYAYFRTGEVLCADGSRVPTGRVTLGGGHADPQIDHRAAMAHYDDVSTAVADVTAGEDEHGIWLAGALRPGTTDEQVRSLTASTLSGDWRRIGGRLELMCAHAVNLPGYPVPRLRAMVASGVQLSLVAAGALSVPAPRPTSDGEDVIVTRVLARIDRRARAHALAADVAAARQAEAARIAAAIGR